jgi:hypothetical protein
LGFDINDKKLNKQLKSIKNISKKIEKLDINNKDAEKIISKLEQEFNNKIRFVTGNIKMKEVYTVNEQFGRLKTYEYEKTLPDSGTYRSGILLPDISFILLRLSEISDSRAGILLPDISFILLRLSEISDSRSGILLPDISFILLRLSEISDSRAGILLPDISFILLRLSEISDSRAGILLPDISFILLRLLDISNLFCEISIRCSFVVVKYDDERVVTCSLRSSTSLKRSLFTIVAEPYRPVDEILIIIL